MSLQIGCRIVNLKCLATFIEQQQIVMIITTRSGNELNRFMLTIKHSYNIDKSCTTESSFWENLQNCQKNRLGLQLKI